ncbi:hypothetical protein NW759_002020 [Fusarium solani]|nr:hypothetical protein NW759_002020 [Fusarium solani]
MSDTEKVNTMTRQCFTEGVGESKEVAVNTIPAILNNIGDDKNNIASAKLAGIMEDLDLNDTEYQSCVSILFVGYIIMQIPSNMMLGRLKLPGVYIYLAMAVWGFTSAAQTVTSSFAGLAVARFFIGFVEAVFFPGLLFYLSIFWCRGKLSQGILALIYMTTALGSHYSSTNNRCVQFYDMANETTERVSLQARLLVTHYLLNHSQMRETWSTFGIAVRQAQVLDIHRRSPRPPSDQRVLKTALLV